MSNLAINGAADHTPVMLSPADAVRAAQESLDSAITATKKATSAVSLAQAKVAELAATETAAVRQHTQVLHEWTHSGDRNDPPALVADPQRLQAAADAAQTLRAANANLGLVERAEVAARENLGAAERAWQAAQNARFTAESDKIAAQMDAVWTTYVGLFDKLIELHIRTNKAGGSLLSPKAFVMIDNPPPRPTRDSYPVGRAFSVQDINTPISGRPLDAARKYWNEFAGAGA